MSSINATAPSGTTEDDSWFESIKTGLENAAPALLDTGTPHLVESVNSTDLTESAELFKLEELKQRYAVYLKNQKTIVELEAMLEKLKTKVATDKSLISSQLSELYNLINPVADGFRSEAMLDRNSLPSFRIGQSN